MMMNKILKEFVDKYQDFKSSNNLKKIEEISNLLNNELLYLMKEQLPGFIENYEEMIDKSQNIISREYKFEIKGGTFHILSPHNARKNKQRKLYSPMELYSFIIDEELSPNQKELALLFLSNSHSILALNMAMNLS
jgi:hypothetical protein